MKNILLLESALYCFNSMCWSLELKIKITGMILITREFVYVSHLKVLAYRHVLIKDQHNGCVKRLGGSSVLIFLSGSKGQFCGV